jgi:hypothetical protein
MAMIGLEKRDPTKQPVEHLAASPTNYADLVSDLEAQDLVSQNDFILADFACVGRLTSCLDRIWDLQIIVADGHFVKYCHHEIWFSFCLILSVMWVGLRVTIEILKDGRTDIVLLIHYGLIFATSIYVIAYRENMYEKFYFPRFLNGDRERTIACSCCCNPEEDESKCDTATRECYHGEMWGKCKENLSCKHEKRVSKERTCNGLMMFVGSLVLCSILWNQGLHFVDGNCLQVEYCELKQQWLVKFTQSIELLLYSVLVIQVFAVGFQLLMYLYWNKLLLWTLKNMILYHADRKEDSFGKICRMTQIASTPGSGLDIFDEIEDDPVPEFWHILIKKYPEFIWDRTRLGEPQKDVKRNLENISLEKIYCFHEYVSSWMREKPGRYYFNSIFIVCTISLSILIFITFYNIISRGANENTDGVIPLILGTFLFMFIMSKMAAVNTLGSEVLKLYSKLELPIIEKELANDKRKVDRHKNDHSCGNTCEGCVVELITQLLNDDDSETGPCKRMALTQATLKQMKEVELTIPISFPSRSCMCLQFRVRQTHINSLFFALVTPVTGLIISAYIAPALKLSQ